MDIVRIKQLDKEILEDLFSSFGKNSQEENNDYLKPPLLGYFKSKVIRKFASDSHSTLYLAKDKDEIIGFTFLSYLEWDSNIFGFKIGRLNHLFIDKLGLSSYNLLKDIIQDCIEEQYVHLHCRLGTKDIPNINLLEKNQFYIADIQLTFSTSDSFLQQPASYSSDKFKMRIADTADLGQLESIVKDAFTDTRFVVDLRYPREKVNKFYYEWVKNSIFDSMQSVFVVEDNSNKRLVGFSICNLDPDTELTLGIKIGSIDLIAVSKEYRNQGIAQMLIRFVLNWFKTKVGRVEIRTQVSNIPAIRAFMKAGLNEISMGIILPAGVSMHRWFKEDF